MTTEQVLHQIQKQHIHSDDSINKLKNEIAIMKQQSHQKELIGIDSSTAFGETTKTQIIKKYVKIKQKKLI